MNKGEQSQSEPIWNQTDLLERTDNDQELVCELLAMFKEDFPRTMESLQSAVASADLKNATTVSHTLKGMLSNLGGTRAAAVAAKLERMASGGEKDSLKDNFDILRREAATLMRELDAYMVEVRR